MLQHLALKFIKIQRAFGPFFIVPIGIISICVFFALSALGIFHSTALSSHDLARIVQILVLALCAINLKQGRKRLSTASMAVLFAVLVLGIASVALSPNPFMASREACLFLGLAGVCMLFADQPPAQWKITALVIVGASAIYAALVLTLIIAIQLQSEHVALESLFLGYSNYRFFNHVQTVSLPLLAMVLSQTQRRSRFSDVAWFALASGWCLLIFIGGRGTMVGIASGCLLAYISAGKKSLAFLKASAIGMAAGLVLYAMVFIALPDLSSTDSGQALASPRNSMGSVHARFDLWKDAFQYIAAAPWLGIGPMHFAHFESAHAAHPHNIYLQIAAEWGVPMLGLILMLVVKGLFRMREAILASGEPRQAATGVGLFATCIAVLVDGFFSGNFVMPVSQVWIAVLIGWAIAWTRQNPPPKMPAPSVTFPVWVSWACRGILIASQAWLLITIWPEFMNIEKHLDAAREMVKHDVDNPRFWSHGWF